MFGAASCARHASLWHGASMAKPPELIGSTDAGRLLGRSPRTVHRLVQSGALKPAMTAPGGAYGAYLFKRSDVEALAAKKAAKKAAA